FFATTPRTPRGRLRRLPLPPNVAGHADAILTLRQTRADATRSRFDDAGERTTVAVHVYPRRRLQHQQLVGGELVGAPHEHSAGGIHHHVARGEQRFHHPLLQLLLVARGLLDEHQQVHHHPPPPYVPMCGKGLSEGWQPFGRIDRTQDDRPV